MTWEQSIKDHALAQARQTVVRNSMATARADNAQAISPEEHETLRLGGKRPESALGRFVFHPHFEKFGGCVVLFNFMVMTMETHATATGDNGVKEFVITTNRFLLVYYTIECGVRLYVTKMAFFLSGWNNMDAVIVVTGLVSEALEILQVGGSGMDQFSMLKSLRMLRLLRLVRLLVAFRELYVLIAGIGRCMKTLFWAAGLIFVVLNVWAILSVEFLDARVKELLPTGRYDNCAWCAKAFTNIWYANLTWFQIVSTADWTTIGRPLVEEFFWPYAFFVLNIFVVMWGLLNLIVAAIVDSNIAAREDDVAIAAKFAAHTHEEAWNSFAQLCDAMDEDGSGDVTVEEFKSFVKENVELQNHLTIMGVQEKDVDDLLHLMDEDGSGRLEHDEFIEQFTAMRTLVEKTTLFFLLKFVQSIQTKVVQQKEIIQSMCTDLAEMRRSCNNTATRRDDPAAVSGDEEDDSRRRENAFVPVEIEAPVAVPGASWQSANASKVPYVDMNTLPPGWYYFGTALPLEASVWCKSVDTRDAHASKNKEPPPEPKEGAQLVTKDEVVRNHSKKWEPLPPKNVHFGGSTQTARSASLPEAMDHSPPRETPAKATGQNAREETVASDDSFFEQTPLQPTPAILPCNVVRPDNGLQEALAITPHSSPLSGKLEL